ncbi:MAG TPA: hypothetical protein VNL17_01995 [Verrucomicrobiae bacterium]|nr:hypothetical protein [Verrucomicrobiae bacterium]
MCPAICRRRSTNETNNQSEALSNTGFNKGQTFHLDSGSQSSAFKLMAMKGLNLGHLYKLLS